MKAILFDLDGTLVDGSEGITKCVQYALRHFDIEEPDLTKFYKFIGPPLLDSFKNYYGFSEQQAVEAVKTYRERYQDTGIFECMLYPGVEQCIRILREQGYRIGMASSKPETFCKRIMEHFGILELFDDIVGATMDGRIGTKEEVLLEVQRRWSDIPAAQMCLIGDTLFDVEGANQVGMACVAVTFGFGDAQEMKNAGAKAICDSMLSLPDILKQIQGC